MQTQAVCPESLLRSLLVCIPTTIAVVNAPGTLTTCWALLPSTYLQSPNTLTEKMLLIYTHFNDADTEARTGKVSMSRSNKQIS